MLGRPPLVLIEWEDSARPAPEWRFIDDLEDLSAVRCQSVGWLVHDGEDVKVLAPNLGNIDSNSDAQACGIIRIPARSIVRVAGLQEATAASADSELRIMR